MAALCRQWPFLPHGRLTAMVNTRWVWRRWDQNSVHLYDCQKGSSPIDSLYRPRDETRHSSDLLIRDKRSRNPHSQGPFLVASSEEPKNAHHYYKQKGQYSIFSFALSAMWEHHYLKRLVCPRVTNTLYPN